MKTPSIFVAALLLGVSAAAQETPRLTDEQSRDVAASAIRSEYPQPCYSSYRKEDLEDFVIRLRRNPLDGNHLNNSVYFYRMAGDVCDYVVERDGKPVRMTQVSSDCCEYGIVAIDRVTGKSYWFTGDQKPRTFKEFAADEQLLPDLSRPTLFTSLYRELVWGESNDNEITSLKQLQDVAEQSFRSAYSPYERDNTWQPHFARWWRRLRSHIHKLELETTYETTSIGTTVRGYAFNGFELTIPRSDPPPKGTPQLFQWALLVKSDGTVERLPSKIIYSSR